MSNKPDVIEQARLSAYFAEMQEEFFEDKLRRIVSFQVVTFHILQLSPTLTRAHSLTKRFPLQGFKYVHLSYSEAVLVMVKAEKRLGRKFTVDEIEDGTMGSLLIESDFDTEKTVSRLPFLFKLTPYLFHSHVPPLFK